MKKLAFCLLAFGVFAAVSAYTPRANVADFEIPGPKVSCIYYV